MNDFTKEELTEIQGFLEVICGGKEISFNVLPELSNKIQSMIDSYDKYECQHESDGIIYKQFGTKYESVDCKQSYNKCIKCDEYYLQSSNE